ncbi:glutathione peroxidase [Holzapfeliella floricola]|uniref:Glutathione peroxidase n=1 Tax=Holzapfeliella floricola DSM 23037 = JCM 16512 TaxID=1423744 RepID=A0A0R2DVL5_9LACO|nr:glutathione peroxidase [Holzapfeliella floricola]KRN04570.1 glutathione peroxidase [Holzapfeliella floricola DSM 23037 = JCM 16512]
MATIYDFSLTEMNGQPINLSDYKEKVLLIVNTASKCGLAPQLETIEQLYQSYKDTGFAVIGLPSNQFHQELENDQETSDYCQRHYGVTFPMTQKVKLNGDDADPLINYLKEQSGKGAIKWNFTKFLIGKDGQLIHRYAPMTSPKKMETEIVKALE